jgi:hypothetical protein
LNEAFNPVVGSRSLIAALRDAAEPDWSVNDQAREAKRTSASEKAEGTVATWSTRAQRRCRAEALAPARDDGPRAASTPRVSHQRKERHSARVQACQGQTK